jgi:hypothetical protein
MPCGLHDQYAVESGTAGWPAQFDGDKELLKKQVADILRETGPTSLYRIYVIGDSRHGWKGFGGCVNDYIYAVLERATRAVADPVWKLKEHM